MGLTFGQTHPRPRRVGRRVAIPAAVAFTVLGSAGAVAAATGAPLPRPVRAAAYGIGLPVDSPAVADVRSTETRVRRDLAGADHSQLAGEVETLRTRLAHVEDDKRVRVQREAQPLIEKANRVLERDKEPQGGGRGPAARQSGTNQSVGQDGENSTPDRAAFTGEKGNEPGGVEGAPGSDGARKSDRRAPGSGPSGSPRQSGGPSNPGPSGGASGSGSSESASSARALSVSGQPATAQTPPVDGHGGGGCDGRDQACGKPEVPSGQGLDGGDRRA